MDNRQASEPPRFRLEALPKWHVQTRVVLDTSKHPHAVVGELEHVYADYVCAALNAADAREKADEACFECGARGRPLVHTMCPPCIEEYEARVDRNNDDDREREIMERR